MGPDLCSVSSCRVGVPGSRTSVAGSLTSQPRLGASGNRLPGAVRIQSCVTFRAALGSLSPLLIPHSRAEPPRLPPERFWCQRQFASASPSPPPALHHHPRRRRPLHSMTLHPPPPGINSRKMSPRLAGRAGRPQATPPLPAIVGGTAVLATVASAVLRRRRAWCIRPRVAPVTARSLATSSTVAAVTGVDAFHDLFQRVLAENRRDASNRGPH